MAATVPATQAEPFRYAGAPFVSAFPPLTALPNQLLLYTHGSQHPQQMILTAAPNSHSPAVVVQPSTALSHFSTSSSSHSSPAPSAGSNSPVKVSPSTASDHSLHVSAFSAFVPASVTASVLSTSSPVSKSPVNGAGTATLSATGRPASSAAIAGLLNLSHSGSSPSTSSSPSLVSNSAASPMLVRVSPAAIVKTEPQHSSHPSPVHAASAAHFVSSAALSTASSATSISSGTSGSSSHSRAADSSSATLESAAHRLTERLAEADGQTAALALLRSLSTSPSSLAAVQSLIDTASRHLSDPSTTTANFLISLTAWLVNEMASAPPAVSSPLSPFSSSSSSSHSLSKRRRSSLPPLPAASDSDDDTCPHCCAQKKGTRWSDKDDTNMLAMLKQGNDWEHIAKALKRTVRALKDRYCYLRKQMRKSGGSGGDKKKKRKKLKRDDVSEPATSEYDSDYSSTDDDDSDDDTHSSSHRPSSLPSKPHSASASTSTSSASHSNPSLGSNHTSERSRSNESADSPADSPPYLSPPSSPSSSSSSSFSSSGSSSLSSPSSAPSMHPWSAAEESQLFALLSAGRTIREASRQLGRSVAAVKGRLQRLKRSKNKRRQEQLQQQQQHEHDEDEMDTGTDETAAHGETHYKFPMTQAAAALVLAGV